jgi:hypothetical protein
MTNTAYDLSFQITHLDMLRDNAQRRGYHAAFRRHDHQISALTASLIEIGVSDYASGAAKLDIAGWQAVNDVGSRVSVRIYNELCDITPLIAEGCYTVEISRHLHLIMYIVEHCLKDGTGIVAKLVRSAIEGLDSLYLRHQALH